MAPKLLRPKDVRENLESFSCITRDAIKHMVTIRGTAGLENEIPDLEEVLLKFAAESKRGIRGGSGGGGAVAGSRGVNTY